MSFAQILTTASKPADHRARPQVPRVRERIPAAILTGIDGALAGNCPWPLYVHGPAGCGKTCAGLWLHDQVRFAAWFTAESLVAIAFEAHSGLWQVIESAPLVIVDELGVRSGDAIDREYLALHRLAELRATAPAVYLTNLSPQAFHARYDDRLFSRYCSGTIVEVDGADQRFCRRA